MKQSRNNPKTGRAGENANTAVCDCTDCLWARLVQYDAPRDPLLAECTRKPQPGSDRFPYQVEVARARKMCPMYKHTDEARTPERRAKVRRTSMACYVLSQPQQTL